MPRKKSGKHYFTKDHENAIIQYVAIDDQRIRTQLYVDFIGPAFNEMVDKIVYTYRFTTLPNIDSLKSECKIWLTTILDKFDPSKGSKAFSYFNVVAKNWLIIQSKKKIKSNRRLVSMDDSMSLSLSDLEMIENHKTEPAQDALIIKKESMSNLFDLMVEIKSRLKSENEMACMDAILTIFSRIDDLDLLNKRAVFVYMRSLSNLNPKQLSVAMSIIRKHYKELVKTGEFDIFF